MFRKFMELFSSENLLDSAYTTTLTMLETDLRMFKASCETLRRKNSVELPFDIKGEDRKINKFERQVRRDVLTHLSIAGTQNIVPGLVLVSIVIDVERIGDYTKNITELATMHQKRLDGGPFEENIAAIENHLHDIFPKVIELLKKQDVEMARDILRREEPIGKMSEAIVYAIVTEDGKGLGVKSAVCLSLYARHLKRINAHLTNIASAVVNPFPRLGFRMKERTPEGENEE
jgi:phosphate uptake regulator